MYVCMRKIKNVYSHSALIYFVNFRVCFYFSNLKHFPCEIFIAYILHYRIYFKLLLTILIIILCNNDNSCQHIDMCLLHMTSIDAKNMFINQVVFQDAVLFMQNYSFDAALI